MNAIPQKSSLDASPRPLRSTGGAAATNSSNDFAGWTLTQLTLEGDKLWRWLCLPFAEKWPEQFAEKTARLEAVDQEIKRRKAGVADSSVGRSAPLRAEPVPVSGLRRAVTNARKRT